MKSWMNWVVKVFVLRFNRELEAMRMNSPAIQRHQRKLILSSPLVRYFFDTQLEERYEAYKDFHQNIPLTDYSYYERKITSLMESSPPIQVPYFAQSSGTTSTKKKWIPTPESMIASNHLLGSWYILNTLYRCKKSPAIFQAKSLLVGGSIYRKTAGYTVGDVSGIMLARVPWYFRSFSVPDIETAILADWQSKIERTALLASEAPDVSLIAGIPTWVMAVLKKVLQTGQVAAVSQLWNGLEAYIHGGVNFEPYRQQFDQVIGRKNFLYLETYNATEGFFAFQDEPSIPGMLLMTKNGIFYEFIPFEKFIIGEREILPLSDITVGRKYVMLVSTYGGLLRYVVGDVIEFISSNPYRLRVAGRIQDYINAFGEDLLLEQASKALTRVAAKHNALIKQYTVAPKYITLNQKGYHDWYIEFEQAPGDIRLFEKQLDNELRIENPNYDQKRQYDLALQNLSIHALPLGTFDEYFKRYHRMGGQSKVQRLRNDREIADKIEKILKNER